MMISFIAKHTRFILRGMVQNLTSIYFAVMNFFARVKRWILRFKTSNSMPMACLLSHAWRLNPEAYAVLFGVIQHTGIPVDDVNGFRCSAGRWYISVKNIGWLSTSDLLKNKVKLTEKENT